jgi:hypothetical protein
MKLKDLIKNYRLISPDENWVKRSQAQLLIYLREKTAGYKTSISDLFFYLKPAFISFLIILIVSFGSIRVFAEVKNSLPGQTLYPVKRLAEKIIYKLAPAENKTNLRIEIAKNRLDEVKKIVQKNKPSEIPPQVKEIAKDFEKEIVALKKEIKKEKVDQLDLPVLDDKKILKIVEKEDLEKLLLETKEAIKEKNITTALEKINEFEKIFFEPEPEEKVEKPKEETKSETETQTTITQPKKIQPDFKTDLIKE